MMRLCRLRKGLLACLAACVFYGIPGEVSWAIDLYFEVRLTTPISEPTVLVITGFTKVMPVNPPYWATEIAANEISAIVDIADVDPGSYVLEVRQPGARRTLSFAVNLDGSVIFDSSPGVQQTGNSIILSP